MYKWPKINKYLESGYCLQGTRLGLDELIYVKCLLRGIGEKKITNNKHYKPSDLFSL